MNGDPPRPRPVRKGTLPVFPRALQDERQLELDRATELSPGQKIRQAKFFDVVDRLGEGGMGKVYRAYEPSMDRYVALKVLKLDVPDRIRARFRREAVVAANFSHPNLPRVLDRGVDRRSGLEWLTMEYLRGRDLGLLLERGRRIAFPLVVDIFAQVLDALDYIHNRRIVHCDVKPDNIFMTRDPYDRRIVVVKLIDFGVCRQLDEEVETRIVVGDPRYMAPEQTFPDGVVGARADLYALGLTLFETMTGQHPFVDELDSYDSLELLRRQVSVDPPSLARFRSDIPDDLVHGLDRIISTACAKEPDRRYPHARAMKKAVQALLSS